MIPVSGWFHRASTSNPAIVARREVDLRLEIGHELVVLEPEADALLDLALGDQLALHPLSNHIGRAARALLAWSMAMSARRSRSGMLIVRCGLADDRPRKAPTWIYLPCSSSGVVTRRSNCFGQRRALPALVDRHQHGELAAAQPRERGVGGNVDVDASRQSPQHGIADVIAEAVVDGLEAVELEREDRELRRRWPPRWPRSRALFAEPLAVEQTRSCRRSRR